MTGGELQAATGEPCPLSPSPLMVAGQMVYTSFMGRGFQLLVSQRIDPTLGDVFLDQVVGQLWNVYEPPSADYRAAFVLTTVEDLVFFGWIYNDGLDDQGRAHVPYCICYLSHGPLTSLQFEQLLDCLERGPTVPLLNRWEPPTEPPLVELNGLAARLGVPLNEVKRNEARDAFIATGSLWAIIGSPPAHPAAPTLMEDSPSDMRWLVVMPVLASILALAACVAWLSGVVR
jgi:hypothetical protein